MNIMDTSEKDFSEERLQKIEKFNRVKFPDDYKKFIRENNGGIPDKKTFVAFDDEFVVERFLSIVEYPNESLYGDYDIAIILTRLDDRLSDNPDLLGNELIPIASLYSGDYICLDYKNHEKPKVVIWFYEDSDKFSPVTRGLCDNFSSFVELLKK